MKLNNNKKSVKISRSLFLLYAVLVCGIVFALPAFAADFIACMTDTYAIADYQRLFVPKAWN